MSRRFRYFRSPIHKADDGLIDHTDYTREHAAALSAVRVASALTEAVRDSAQHNTLRKGDRSPVTIADFGSQALVCRVLQKAFPDDAVIAEESADALREGSNVEVLDRIMEHVNRQVPGAGTEDVLAWIDRGSSGRYSERFWTLDPIDGTKGFLRGDQYAVALALLVEGRTVVAALACPAMRSGPDSQAGLVLTAVKGLGTWLHPLEGDRQPEPVRVSGTSDPAQARYCESFESGHSSHRGSALVSARLGIRREPIRMDSQAKYAMVARGEADIYMRLPRRPDYVEKIWDHAAGALVVQEAGGAVTDVRGTALDFTGGRTLVDNVGVIVTNGHLHEGLLRALASSEAQEAG